MSAIELADVSVAYGGVPVLRRLSMRAETGAWIGLIGPNGAGKTTLLRSIAGLVPCSGDIRLTGMPISGMSKRRLAQLLSHVPQRPTLPASMTVAEYLLLGRTPYIPYLGTESRRDLEVVADALRRLGLVSFAQRSLGSLSGGEAQRVVLGRALAQQAPVLLFDEPTAALDVGHQQQVLELIDELRIERGLTVLSAMHDLALAGQFADRLLLLSKGQAVAEGPARDILTESAIRDHYGVVVRIREDEDGGILVLPARRGRLAATTSGERHL